MAPRGAGGEFHRRHRLLVRKPVREPRSGEQAIAVYVLDAQWNLPAVATMHANIESLAHVPLLYYVGVGYSMPRSDSDVTPGRIFANTPARSPR